LFTLRFRTACIVRHRFSRLLAAALLTQFAPAAHAVERCPKPVVAALAQRAGIAPAKGEAPVVAQASKVWPHDPNVLLAALAYGKREDDRRTLVVAMVDAGTRRVLSDYVVPLREDAVLRFLPYSLDIDTARYQLAPDVRAFGVRFESFSTVDCPDRLAKDELTLFVPNGAVLRPVLPRLATSRLLAKAGCFGGSGAQQLVYDDATLTVAVAPAASNGLADLVVTARIQQVTGMVDPHAPARQERVTLRYDGSAYRLGKGTAPWWLTLSSWDGR
jgi:hypothetical protein